MQVKHLTSKLKKMNIDEIIDDDRKVLIKKMLKSEPKWEGMKAMVNCHVAGKLSKIKDITDEIKECCQVTTSDDIRMASRIKIKNIYVYSMDYKKMKQHISYMVLLRTGEIARVVTFYVNIKTSMVFALVDLFKLCENPFLLEKYAYHLLNVKATNQTTVIPVNNIEEVLFYMPLKKVSHLVSQLPNLFGHSALKVITEL